MNKERLTQVAEWLEAGAPERRFNMNRLLDTETTTDRTNWCGTECCIAGYVVTRFWPEDVVMAEKDGSADTLAGEILDLEPEMADRLFYPRNTVEDWSAITPEQAALVVRNLLQHGEVDWEIIL
jgi:hypothetical protein